MKNDPWFPKKYALTKKIILDKLLYSNQRWQIYSTTDKQKALITISELANEWIDKGLLEESTLHLFEFGSKQYSYIISDGRYALVPLIGDKPSRTISKSDALSFANALKLTREIVSDVSLENAIFLEQFSRILPTFETVSTPDDSMVAGTYISGGIPIPITATRRIAALSKNMDPEDVENIAEIIGVKLEKSEQLRKGKEKGKTSVTKKHFSLSGAKYLEDFFIENVIDIVQHLDRYEKLGITFPLPIILYGEPGTGKTYAVERLAEFLDWPLYSINSSTIGSPYIHQTGKKISEIFEKAFTTSPSIIVIDEMEAFLGKRDSAQEHKVEEVDEFLRLLPKAVENKVLVVGTTNMISSLDPAVIRTGRFDRKIEVKMPEAEDIKSMIKEQIKSLPIAKNIDFTSLIGKLVGKPRSDVTFVIKEAARLTAFRGKSRITQEEIDLATKRLTSIQKEQHNRIGFAT